MKNLTLKFNDKFQLLKKKHVQIVENFNKLHELKYIISPY